VIRVYVDMVADLFHVGHLNLIKKAKECGDYLIVGIHSDLDVESYKRKPIISEEDRYEIISSCKFIDRVIRAAPLKITRKFIDENDIDIVIHGDDENPVYKEQYKIPVELGIMRYLPYTKGVSTTEIIKRIKEKLKSDSRA